MKVEEVERGEGKMKRSIYVMREWTRRWMKGIRTGGRYKVIIGGLEEEKDKEEGERRW